MGILTVYLLVIITTVFWGANFVLAGPILADLPPLWAAAFRFVLAAALMFVIAGVRRDELFSLLRRNVWAYILLGTVGIGAFNLFFFSAMQSTSASNAALIMGINPLLTALLAAVIVGERPTARHLLALPIALLGVVVVISHGDIGTLTSFGFTHGDLLMLGATVSWALYTVFFRRYMGQGSPIANTSWVMAVGAIVLLPVAIGSDSHVHTLGLNASIAMATLVVGGTVLAFLFWGIGIARLGATRTALFLNLVPVFTMLIGAVLGTVPSAAQLVGGVLVLGGVTISMLPQQRPVTAN